jgi:hypothetical protein
MTRTFTQKGQAYGAVPCNITAKIDGVVVFSGEVPTINTPIPPLPNLDLDLGTPLFSWTKPIDFAGTCELEIAVSGSQLIITDTIADYVNRKDSSATGDFYQIEIDGVVYSDPFIDEKINGVAQAGPYNPELPGQWYWTVNPGSTFTTTVNIMAGILPEPTPPEENTP